MPLSANDFIEQQLDERLCALEEHFSGHALSFRGPLVGGVDDIVRASVEQRRMQQDGVDRLVVVLTTNGGYIEVVQRIVDTLRNHYDVVEFVVPDSAFSAGTVLVMSGDAIHMDYYSRLGPIDPIRDYHTLLEDYRSKMGHRGVVHTAGNYRPFG